MIARIYIFIVLAIVLPDVYVYVRYLRRRTDLSVFQHMLWWVPGIIMTAYTVGLSVIRDFAPGNMTWLNVYLFLFGLIIVPKLLFVICSFVGLVVRRAFSLKRNCGNFVGIVLVLFSLYMLIYGSTVGVRKFTVKHVNLYFDDLPSAFDGYKIVQFTDLHAGSIEADVLERAVEAINSSDADAVVFTGDIQNMLPDELNRYDTELSSIRAKDGVFSVLGNHDYSEYVKADSAVCLANERRLIARERGYGWTLLMNEHRVIRRGSDSIVIAGEENEGKKSSTHKPDIEKTLSGVSPGAFIVLLQHNPVAWRSHILPGADVRLTLSGHTHGGQISMFGHRPTQLSGVEDSGLYRDGRHFLYVSTGVGGLVPFRFGISPEIVVFTLRKIK